MKYIRGFDSLRAFSILLVVTSHLGLRSQLPDVNFVQDRLWVLISGATGVNVFFTLSGFLITSILLSERIKKDSINFKNFYIRRFLRLLPPLVVFYTATAILMDQGLISANGIGFTYSVFYAYNFIPNQYYTPELAHTWTLALEEQFYLTWPFVIGFIRKKNHILVLLFSIIVICSCVVWILPYTGVLGNYNIGRWFIPAVAPILVGCYFAILEAKFKTKWQLSFKGNVKILMIVLFIMAFPLYAPKVLFPAVIILNSISIGLFLVWIVHNQSSKLVAILELKPLLYIGRISYGIYIFQGLFLRTGPGSDFWIQQFPQNIIFTIVAAVLSYHLLEKPILTLKRRFN